MKTDSILFLYQIWLFIFVLHSSDVRFQIIKFCRKDLNLPIYTYRLLKRDEIFEKKLVRPEYGDSPAVPPVPGISMPVLLRDLV